MQNAETEMDLSGSDSASAEVYAVFLLLLWELIHVLYSPSDLISESLGKSKEQQT